MPLSQAIRTPLVPSELAADLANPENVRTLQNAQIAATGEVGKGWESSDLGGRAAQLSTRANLAHRDGREREGQVLEMQSKDLAQQAALWAPRVQNITDVRSLRDGADWAAGALGNTRTSIAPAIGGLIGSGVGLVAAPFTAGVVNPVTAGFAGAALAGGSMERDEAMMGAMNDPTVRATKTMDEINNASLVKGTINSVLEALVPTVLGGKVLTGAGIKSVVRSAMGKVGTEAERAMEAQVEAGVREAIVNGGLKAAAKAVAKEQLKEGAGEFATEGVQSLVGQATQNSLLNKPLSDLDYKQALNEGAAGAVAGHAMGTVGGAAEVGHAYMGAGARKVSDIKADIKSDPSQYVADKVADLGGGLGTLGAKALSGYERMTSPAHRAFDTLVSPNVSPATIDALAMQWANQVLVETKGKGSTPQEIADAKEFVLKSSKGDTNAGRVYRDKLSIDHHEGRAAAGDMAIANETGAPKKSLMQGTLVDDFGEQEGRDPSDDRVTDDFGNVTRTPGVSSFDAQSQAEASQIGQPVIPRQGLTTKGAPLPQLESTADIWRKQGVDEKLLAATSDKTDGAQRQMAIGLLGWMSRGFKDAEGNVFVPESLTARYGAKASKMIQSLAKTAFEQGVIGHAEAAMAPQIMNMATDQHLNATSVNDSVIAAIPEYARGMYKPYVEDIKGMLRHAVANGTNKKQEEALLTVFGTKEAIAQAMSKMSEPKNKVHTLTVESAATGRPTESDDLTYGDSEHGGVLTAGDAPRFTGVDGDNTPYDLKDEAQKAKLANDTKAGPAHTANTVGVWSRIKSEYDAEPVGAEMSERERAEDELLEQYGHHFLKEKELALLDEYGGTVANYINSKHPGARQSILKSIDKRFVMVRHNAVGEGQASDTITKDQVAAFEENFDPRGPAALVGKGALFLEREGLAGGFKTSAMRLAKHTWFNGEKGSKVAPGVGMHGIYQDVLSAVGALMVADPRFTGRIGYKVSVGGETHWLGQGEQMPSNFKLPKGDLAAAKEQALKSLAEGDKPSAQVRFATSSREMYKALREFSEKEGTSPKWARWLTKELKQQPKETRVEFEKRITTLYRSFRRDDSVELSDGQTHGNTTGWGESTLDIVPSEVTDDDSVKGTLRASDPKGDGPIERDATGRILGGPTEGAQEGNARGGKLGESRPGDSKGVAVVKSEPSPTEMTPARLKALDSLERAKDWAFEKLRMGVPAFNKALGEMKLSDEQRKRLVSALTVLSKLAPDGIRKQFDKSLTGQQAAAVVKRASVALMSVRGTIKTPETEGVKDGDVTGQPGVGKGARGQTPATRNPSGQESGTANDTGRGLTLPDVGQASGTGDTGRGKTGVVAGTGQVQRGASSGVSDQRAGKLTPKSLDDAIHDEKYDALDSVDKLMQFARHVNLRDGEIEARDAAGESLSARDEGIGALAGQLVYEAKGFIKNPNSFSGTDFESFFEGVEHTDADVTAFVKALAGVKQSTQTADIGTGARATKEEVAAAKQHILDTLGDSVKTSFVKHFGDNSSGSWTPGATINTIRIALNGDVLGTAYHESMHEFFNQLGEAGSTATQALLKRVAANPILNRKLELLLADHPEAAAQVRSNPEEAVAFMYQFWRAGLLKLGPETQTFFEKIKAFFSKITGHVPAAIRDANEVEAVLQAFSSGVLKEDSTREAVLKVMNANSEAHNAAMENLDKAGRDIIRNFGKIVMSAEAMLKATKNKHMVSISNRFHQESGEAKGENQDLIHATKQQMGIWTNRLENILTGSTASGEKYTEADLELARKALSSGVPAKDRIAKEIVAKIEAFNEAMFKYISSRGVSRLDDATHTWVPVEHRKDYFRRVWDTEAVTNGAEKFRSMLLEHHMKELESIARQANGEIANGDTVDPGFASSKELKKDAADRQVVTPDMVADAIISRLLNANGQVELSESTSSLGMTPVATSVNRRSLSWIDAKTFDEFLSKDLTNIMSGYVSSMVKRAEHTKVFGNGAERLKADVDKAVLLEMGGDKLVSSAESALPAAIKVWRKAAAVAQGKGEEFTEPFPTLRSVGQAQHFATAGEDQGLKDLSKALTDLGQGFRAVMAMEGTLGADCSPALRSVNSLLMTYQTLRTLPLVLFSSINDVMGITAQDGATLSDAWDAFLSGMREIKLSWSDKKSKDHKAERAEGWGIVDAGPALDRLGQTYGSMYMNERARNFSNSFFKWVGMKGWDRGVRIMAGAVAERAIKAYRVEGLDKNDPAAVARSEALFGKDFDHSTIKLDANGELDINDPVNQAAVMRWVSNAIMSPNSAHRTIWGSDTRLASFWMLKQFAYTFHRVMLKNALAQAKLGNLRPVMVLALGYTPIAIAADAVKEIMVPGDEPAWMKMGLGGYLRHGVDRAGVFGVPGMIYDSVSYDYGAGLLGPSLSQVAHVPFDSVAETTVGALPFGGRLRKLVDDGE